jgi:Fur family transcriptional regulator, peroxide stress response regulator
MKRPSPELHILMERFASVIRRAGVRRTPQRCEIYRQIASTDAHPDIEAIHRQVRRAMPGISLDTVYRALALFADLGLVSTIRPLGHRVRYDANVSPHHHFVCTACGAALDFEDRDFDNLSVPASASVLGRVVTRHVELRGLCAACASGPSPAAAISRSSRARHIRPIGTRSHRRYRKETRRD